MTNNINFNGTIEGLGGPLLAWTDFTKVIFLYYRKGITYKVPKLETKKTTKDGKEVEEQVLTFDNHTIDDVKDITDTTPISHIEVRYIPASLKVGTNTTGALVSNEDKSIWTSIKDWLYLPIGLTSSLASTIGDSYMNSLFQTGEWTNVIPRLKPVIVVDQNRQVSSYVKQSKRTLDDNSEDGLKEVEYSNITAKNDTLTVTLVTTKDNLLLQIITRKLSYWMEDQRNSQDATIVNGIVMENGAPTYASYEPYPDEDHKWDKSNSKYFIKRVYLSNGPKSRLFNYINDDIFFRNGKLTGYSIIPDNTGDRVQVTFTLERTTTAEEAWLYQKHKITAKNKTVETPPPNPGDTNLVVTGATDNGIIEKIKGIVGKYTPITWKQQNSTPITWE